MALEYSYLTASVIVFMVMLVVQAFAGLGQHGLVPLAGSRDALEPDGTFAARAKRANQNMLEALMLFVPLVIVAVETGRANETTQMAAGLFLGARMFYAPLYWFGVPWLRTLIWAVGLIAIILILLQVLPFSGAS